MRYACCQQRRLRAVREGGDLNGIEWLEVSDSDAPSDDLRQRTLVLRLLAPAPGLTAGHVVVDGGERIREVDVEWIAAGDDLPAGEDPVLVAGLADPGTLLVVRTAGRGDFSRYTLRLVVPGTDEPAAGFDPLLASVDFTFKVECDTDFDCRADPECPPEPPALPFTDGQAIDYLAKDYDSFRRVLLDRLSLLAPDWSERSPADLGVTLVELLAYLGDQLSYQQDAVATEAYLGTARRRVSLRRHARLVDHVVHDGAAARVWAQVRATGEGVLLPARTALLTRVPGVPERVEPGDRDHRAALAAGAETFETLEASRLHESHARFDLWTWGDAACCLPRGATSATLLGHHPTLKAGDVLVLLEVASPTTGLEADADRSHRQAVRLTSVTSAHDPSGGLFTQDPPAPDPVEVTELSWDEEDALPFPLCVSSAEHPSVVIGEARGNVVLAEHGRSVEQDLGVVPAPRLSYGRRSSGVPCEDAGQADVPVRLRPVLAAAPVSQVGPPPAPVRAEAAADPGLLGDLAALDLTPRLLGWLEDRDVRFSDGTPVLRGGGDAFSVSDGTTVALVGVQAGTVTLRGRPASATACAVADPARTAPALTVTGTLLGAEETWVPRRDLLSSGPGAAELVVEVEHDGTAALRFGDGVHGRRPATGTALHARYRVGNGPAGNVGAGALGHVVLAESGVLGVGNDLPARGGVPPESAEEIRRDAPEAFLVPRRAVTPADYVAVAGRHRQVQRAEATFRWTGSWHTVFLTADRVGGLAVDERFETRLREHLEPYRMAGYDLEVDAPQPVALDVALAVCARPGHHPGDVRVAVLDALSARTLDGGGRGVFHPDAWTFGQAVHLSVLIAAAQAVPGVESVTAERFERLHEPASSGLLTGVLAMGRLEVARLDNDPSFPERGVLTVSVGGGTG